MDKWSNWKPLRRQEIRRFWNSDVPVWKFARFVITLNAGLLVDINFSVHVGPIPLLHRGMVVHRLFEGVQGTFRELFSEQATGLYNLFLVPDNRNVHEQQHKPVDYNWSGGGLIDSRVQNTSKTTFRKSPRASFLKPSNY